MCGRYTLKATPELVADQFQFEELAEARPRYNIAPSQLVGCVRMMAVSKIWEGVMLRWGLIPSWAKDPAIGQKLINARAETVAEKPSFRHSFRRRRCLVVADGYYEWKKEKRGKQPYYIRMNDGRPFAFAGIWGHWTDGEGQTIESCAMLTTEPNELLATIHHRMPVYVSDFETRGLWWMTGSFPPRSFTAFAVLYSYPGADMVTFPVNLKVNNPRFDEPECIETVDV